MSHIHGINTLEEPDEHEASPPKVVVVVGGGSAGVHIVVITLTC